MTIKEEHDRVADELHHAMIDKMLVQSCLNCEHFADDVGLCLKWQQKPPPKVIVFSCGSVHWFPKLPF
jgi:hypothetical protein